MAVVLIDTDVLGGSATFRLGRSRWSLGGRASTAGSGGPLCSWPLQAASIEVSRQHDPATARWRDVAASGILPAVSAVTVAELWHGARQPEHPGLESHLAMLLCLPADAAIGRKAGGFLRQFHPSHGLQLGDALIAATASVHAIPLWTPFPHCRRDVLPLSGTPKKRIGDRAFSQSSGTNL